jgi:hypothetical protein
VEKVAKKLGFFENKKTMPKLNSRPMGETSPNPVTLFLALASPGNRTKRTFFSSLRALKNPQTNFFSSASQVKDKLRPYIEI